MRGGYPFAIGPGPIRPSEIRGLALWLDAADAKTILGDDGNPAAVGTAVKQWSDKGPNAAHGVQTATAPRPAYVNPGLPGIQFDGIDDALMVAFPALVSGKSGATVFLAIQSASVGAGFVRPFLVSSGAGAASTRLSVNRNSGELAQAVVRRLDGDAASSMVAGTAASTTRVEIECHLVDFGAGTGAMRRNGADVGSMTGVPTGTFDTTGSTAVCVGSNNGANVLAGTLHEAIVYGRALVAGERAAVERYLRAKWGTA